MAETITKAIDALTSAAFIEGGVSIERTDEARERTEQRKRELIEAIAACPPQAVAAQAPAAVHTKLSADAGRLAYVADQIRALEPVGSEGDVFLTEVIQVLKDCAEALTTPTLPATEYCSAGDLARHGMTPRDKGTQDQISAVMLQHGTPEQQLQALATCCNVSPDSIKAMVAAAQAEVQAEPVAWANWKVGSTSYAPYRTRKQAEASVSQSAIAATQEGPYEVVPLYTAPQAQPAFQQRVQPWMMECFGAEIAADRIERNHRFLEEALELVQATGCTKYEAFKLVNYVFKRPVGKPAQEVGGVMVTLAAHCLANGLDMQACAETELARIWTKVPEIRAKQAAKPKHSPLPMAQGADPLDEISEALHDYHYALDTRQHGGSAANAAVDAIQEVLGVHWVRDQEKDRRAAMAAAQEGGNAAKEA